jgi:hypothetical protein
VIRAILAAAKDRSFLTNHKPGEQRRGKGHGMGGAASVCGQPRTDAASLPPPRKAPSHRRHNSRHQVVLRARPSSPFVALAPAPAGPSEYVQGLSYEECATLLNVDVGNEALMNDIYDTGGVWRGWVAGCCWGGGCC